MKKLVQRTLAQVLVVTLICVTMITLPYVGVNASGILVISDNFESETVDTTPTNWNNTRDGVGSVVVAQELGNQYAQLSSSGTSSDVVKRTLTTPLSLAGNGANVVIETDIRTALTAKQAIFINYDYDQLISELYDDYFKVVTFDNEKIWGMNGVWPDTITEERGFTDLPRLDGDLGTFTPDQWTKLKIVIDIDNSKIIYYVNENYVFEGAFDALHMRNMPFLETIGFSGSLDVDNLRVYYQYQAPEARLLVNQDGRISKSSQTAGISFSTDMDSATLNANTISLYKNGVLETYTGTYSSLNKVYTLLPTNEFDASATYSIELSSEIYANNIPEHYEQGKLTRTKQFTFSIDTVAKSNDATLADLVFDNHSVNGFVADQYDYKVQRSYRFNESTDNVFRAYDVVATANNPNATVKVIAECKGFIRVQVTAEDGYTTREYRLFVTELGKNLYFNSGFETTDSNMYGPPWKVRYGAGMISTDQHKTGTKSLYIMRASASTFHQQQIQLLMDKPYIATISAKADTGSAAFNHYLDLGMAEGYDSLASNYDANKTKCYDARGGYLGTNNPFKSLTAYQNGWQKGYMAFTVDKIGNNKVRTPMVHTISNWAGPESKYWVDDMYIGELTVANVKVTASQSALYKPTSGSVTVNLSAEILNQFGNHVGLEAESIKMWKLIGTPQGVTLDSANGKVVIDSNVNPGKIMVEAVVDSVTNPDQTTTGGRCAISILSDGKSVNLADVEIDGRGIYGFDGNVENYTIDLPYHYTENNFNNFLMPKVIARPEDPTAAVSVSYPQTVDGGIITIAVNAADHSASRVYSLTLKPIGKNLYTDGSFENGTTGNWVVSEGGSVALSSAEKLAGNHSLLMSYDSAISHGFEPIIVSTDKRYIASWGMKTNPAEGAYYAIEDFGWKDATWKAYDYNGVLGTITTKTDVGNGWSKSLFLFTMNKIDFGNADAVTTYFTHYNWAGGAKSYWIDEAYLSELIISDVKLTASQTTAVIPTSGSETITITPSILNQFGNSADLENETVKSWRIVGNADGISIDNNGVLSIGKEAKQGIVTVEAVVEPSFGSVQTGIAGRIHIPVLSGSEQEISYQSAMGGITAIEAGNITSKIIFTNNSADIVPMKFYTALYLKEGNALKLQDVLLTEVEIGEYEILNSEMNTIYVPDETNYIVKSFAWTGEEKPLMDSVILD